MFQNPKGSSALQDIKYSFPKPHVQCISEFEKQKKGGKQLSTFYSLTN